MRHIYVLMLVIALTITPCLAMETEQDERSPIETLIEQDRLSDQSEQHHEQEQRNSLEILIDEDRASAHNHENDKNAPLGCFSTTKCTGNCSFRLFKCETIITLLKSS